MQFKIVMALCLSMLLPLSVQAKECVILLHGLGRSHLSLNKLESALQANYTTFNHSYASRTLTTEKLADDVISRNLLQCQGFEKIHFVTHSMGGILVRQYLSHHTIDNLGRVVMLGPPNQGSQTIDKLKWLPGFKFIVGPAGLQLGTGLESITRQLEEIDFELGVIAGNKSINLFLSTLLPSSDDGKVTVNNTKIKGMSDHIVMPVTHPFMMKNKKVIKQVIHFLQHGNFDTATKSNYKSSLSALK